MNNFGNKEETENKHKTKNINYINIQNIIFLKNIWILGFISFLNILKKYIYFMKDGILSG